MEAGQASGERGSAAAVPGSEPGPSPRLRNTDHGEGDSGGRVPPRLAFQLTESDLLHAYRFHRNRYSRNWLLPLTASSLFTLLGAAGVIYGIGRHAYPIWYVLCGVFIAYNLWYVLSLTFWPYLSLSNRRRIRREVARRSEFTLDLDEGGFREVTASSSTVLRWDGFQRYAESKHAFLLYARDSESWIIPKETLTPELCDRIRALISRKLPTRGSPAAAARTVHVGTLEQLQADHSDGDSGRGLPPRLVFQLTTTDLLRANRFHRNRYSRRWLWWILTSSLLALLMAVELIYSLVRAPGIIQRPPQLLLGIAILVLSLYLVITITFWPHMSVPTRRRIRREVNKFGALTVVLDESGARYDTANGSTAIRWDGFRGYAESKDAFLLYNSDFQFGVIPKETLTPEAIDRIGALLSRKLRPR